MNIKDNTNSLNSLSSSKPLPLFGFQEIETQLLENFRNNRLHHALLFSGNKGVGKASFAHQLATKIIGQDSSNQINLTNNPNFLLIQREVNQKQELKRDITIDSVRKINDFISLTAANSDYRVIIIDAIDEMNKNSANAILKALEEPPTNIFFFLINHNSKKTPLTIQSRCNIIKIKPLNYDIFTKALMQAEPTINSDDLKTLFIISAGSISLALNFHAHSAIKLYSDIISHNTTPNLIKKITDKNFPWMIFEQIINFYLSQITKIISEVNNIDYISESEKEYFNQNKHNLRNNSQDIFNISDKVNKLLSDTRNLNLDKKQTIINIFNIIRT